MNPANDVAMRTLFPIHCALNIRIIFVTADDKKTFCIIIHEPGRVCNFFVFSSETNQMIFTPFQIIQWIPNEEILENCIDISPNSKQLVTIHNNDFLLVDLQTAKHTVLEINKLNVKKPQFVKFLDDQSFIVVEEGHLHIVDLVSVKTYKLDKFAIQNCKAIFVNKKDRKVLAIEHINNEVIFYETPLAEELKWEKVYQEIARQECKKLYYRQNYITFSNLTYNFDDYGGLFVISSKICNFDNYGESGTFEEHSDNVTKYLDIFGSPTKIITNLDYPFIIGNYKLEGLFIIRWQDKIFVLNSDITPNCWLCLVELDKFVFYRFAKLIANGIFGGSHWHKFLMQGLYDPRLLMLIWDFCETPVDPEDYKDSIKRIGKNKIFPAIIGD